MTIGNPFEIIDGDNLKFSADVLKRIFYNFKEKRVFVISVLGPQSSGKSTLLNFLFGCKFGTGTGRCTKGVYGTYINIDHPHYDMILVLDTEGLQSVEKDDEEFDRKITLFCLAISHAVIVNIKGDMHNSMKRLLEICVLALHQLKKTKMPIPSVYFCFNQNPANSKEPFIKQLENITAEIVEAAPEAAETAKMMEVPEDDMFVLGFAFNVKSAEKKEEQGELIEWSRCSPIPGFAIEVSKITTRLFEQMDENEDRVDSSKRQFKYPHHWLEMVIDIWVGIGKYPDLIAFRNVTMMRNEQRLRSLLEQLETELLLSGPAATRREKFVKDRVEELDKDKLAVQHYVDKMQDQHSRNIKDYLTSINDQMKKKLLENAKDYKFDDDQQRKYLARIAARVEHYEIEMGEMLKDQIQAAQIEASKRKGQHELMGYMRRIIAKTEKEYTEEDEEEVGNLFEEKWDSILGKMQKDLAIGKLILRFPS